jgi:signal transduction histidine kinase
VNSLLDFASVDAGRLQATFRPVLLTHYVEDLASLFRSAVERAGLTYSVETSNPDQIVYTDPGCIEKIIYNLISNALKYTSTGGIIVRGFCNTLTTYVIEVEDTGMGIPEDQISEIFKRFHRVDNKSARNIEGTGIGLALTKELSRVIHGDLTVESKTSGSRTPTRSASRYGSGSVFRVSLPLGYTHLPIDQVQLEESEDADLENAYGYSRRAIADELTDAFEGQARNPGSGDDDNTSAGETGAELAVNREAK